MSCRTLSQCCRHRSRQPIVAHIQFLQVLEVRNAQGWDRYMLLALLSAVRAATLPLPPPKKGCGTGQPGGFPTGPWLGRGLTVPKIQWLWRCLLLPVVTDLESVLA